MSAISTHLSVCFINPFVTATPWAARRFGFLTHRQRRATSSAAVDDGFCVRA